MTDDLTRRIEEASPIRSEALLRSLLGGGASADGPYTHTFTPDVTPYYETDAEEAFAYWLIDNDPSASLPERLASVGLLPASFTLDIALNERPSLTFQYDREDRP